MQVGTSSDATPDRQIAQLRVPPHSVEGESSVLGGLLLDNQAWDSVADVLSEEDFYRYEHRLVFGAIFAIVNASRPADVITVFEYLQGQGKAEEAGGLAYLNALAQYVPGTANIRRYAEIVRDRSVLRQLLTASDQIATQKAGRSPISLTNRSKRFSALASRGSATNRASKTWGPWLSPC
jgi:replicative DNA helicase